MSAAGDLFVVAAPSGAGKTSLTRALLEREPGIRLSVSYTTRPPRPGERDGVDYHFVAAERFWALQSGGEFLEHAQVHGNWYATGATWLKAQVDQGQDVLLEIDWQGALQVRSTMLLLIRSLLRRSTTSRASCGRRDSAANGSASGTGRCSDN
jgi:guanylate kinase